MNVVYWPETPLGPLWAQLQADALVRLNWGQLPAEATPISHPAFDALDAYFAKGTPLSPSVLNQCNPAGGTAFQRKIWQALLDIPHGQTWTYAQLAAYAGSSPRAVGGAVGANPLPLFVPCHRVVGQKGALTGFSAPGGVATKAFLLQHEGVRFNPKGSLCTC